MVEEVYKIIANKTKIVNIFITSSNCAKDNPIASVALVKDKTSGAHPGHAEVRNAGITAKNPYPFLQAAIFIFRLKTLNVIISPDRTEIITKDKIFEGIHKSVRI